MRLRQRVAVIAAAAAAVGLGGVPQATAAEPVGNFITSPLSAEPGRMWQTDRVVWALAHSQGVLYVGGSFNNVRPPGAAPGTDQTAQARLAAFDANTGAFITSWRPTVTGGDVFALNVSPDGSRLYVGGNFERVNGSFRNKAAAFDITNPRAPQLLSVAQFGANLNGKVNDIASSDEQVWLGGTFTRASGATRGRVAAYDVPTGDLTPFNVQLDGATQFNAPFVSTLEEREGRLYIGGMFHQVNGVNSHALGVLDAATGANVPGFTVPYIIPESYVVGLQEADGRLYIVGRADRTGGNLNRLEGVMAMNSQTGQILWGTDRHRCYGDAFAMQVVHGVLWTATHAHDCGPIGGHPEASPRFYAAVLGQDPVTGELAHFYPEVAGSFSVSGSLNSTRALATDGNRLFVGGGFLRADGVGQQNLTFFDTGSPSAAPLKIPATATPSSTGGVRVTWPASADDDDRSLTYVVRRRNSSAAIATIVADSTFWDRPQLSFTDTGVSSGESVFYRVRVSDGDTSRLSNASNTVTAP